MNKTKQLLQGNSSINATISYGGGGSGGSSGNQNTGIYDGVDGSCFWGSTAAAAATIGTAMAPNPVSLLGAAAAWGSAIDSCTSAAARTSPNSHGGSQGGNRGSSSFSCFDGPDAK